MINIEIDYEVAEDVTRKVLMDAYNMAEEQGDEELMEQILPVLRYFCSQDQFTTWEKWKRIIKELNYG